MNKHVRLQRLSRRNQETSTLTDNDANRPHFNLNLGMNGAHHFPNMEVHVIGKLWRGDMLKPWRNMRHGKIKSEKVDVADRSAALLDARWRDLQNLAPRLAPKTLPRQAPRRAPRRAPQRVLRQPAQRQAPTPSGMVLGGNVHSVPGSFISKSC